MNAFTAAFNRALRIGVRHPLDTLNPMAFFIMVTALMSLANAHVPIDVQSELAVATLWVVLLLATMLTSNNAYAQDFDDGSLELLVAHQPFLYGSVHGTFLARWLLTILPLLVLVPLSAWILNLNLHIYWILIVTMVAGSIVFTLFGMLGAVLTLGIGRNGFLLALLVLPLYVPMLLLGVGGCQRYASNEPYEFALISVWAMAIGAITFLPFAISALLRVSQEY